MLHKFLAILTLLVPAILCRQETVPPGQVTTNLTFNFVDGTASLSALSAGGLVSSVVISTTSLDIFAQALAGSPTLVCTNQTGTQTYYNGLFVPIQVNRAICYDRFEFMLNPSTPAGTPAFGQGFLRLLTVANPGSLGLGFGEQGALGFASLVKSCVQQATIAQNTVGFSVVKPLFVSAPPTGFLDVGYVPSTRYVPGSLKNLTVALGLPGQWSVPFNSYATIDIGSGVPNVTSVNSTITFALSSAFNLMPNTSSVIDLFQRLYPATTYIDTVFGGLNTLTFSCGITPSRNLTYTMDGQSFPFDHQSFVVTSGSVCYFAFASPTSSSTAALVGAEYSLGNLFLYNYYLLFDYDAKRARLGLVS